MKKNTLTLKDEINMLIMHIKELKRHGQHRMAERLRNVLIEEVMSSQKETLKKVREL